MKTEMEIILYRGCSTIERNGVDGVVSTSSVQDQENNKEKTRKMK